MGIKPTNTAMTILVPSEIPALNEGLQTPESTLQPASMTHTATDS